MKKAIIDEIIRVEGGYVNDRSDSGGETNWGVTKAVALSYGYEDDMREMPREVAFDIYCAKYWDSVRGDDIFNLSGDIAKEVVDTAINMGPMRAGKFLQRSLNVFNSEQKYYDDIIVDGHVGSGTIAALKMYVEKRPDYILVRSLNCLQGAFYIELAERREKDEKFIFGWFKNRVGL